MSGKITATAALLVIIFGFPHGAAAQAAAGDRVEAPSLSHPSGFYDESFYVEIHADDPRAVIRYELDGSAPGPHSPMYSDPIRIRSRTEEGPHLAAIQTTPGEAPPDWRWREPYGAVRRGMVVRAYAELPGGPASEVVTATYLFTSDGDPPAYEIPVILIATDSLNLFDYDTGIYVPGRTHDEDPDWESYWGTGNYHNRGREWERPAHLTLVEPDGSIAVSQDVGLRIHGGGSRSLPQKSLRLYARSDYGNSTIDHAVFPDQSRTEFKRLILRNNGQNFTSGAFADGVMHVLVRGLDLEVQAFRSAVVFINGEYWGIHNIRERLDRHYLAAHHGVDEVDILEYYGSPKEGSPDHYLQLLDFVEEADFSVPGTWEYLQSQMDLENYATYNAANIYAGNTDWPGNNIEFWRPAAPDGRWRWLFFDLDAALGRAVTPTVNMLEHISAPDSDHYSNNPEATLLMRRLLGSEDFRRLIITTIADQLNTVFHPDRVVSTIDSLHRIVEPYVPEHMDRWRRPAEFFLWEWQVDALKSFARNRPDVVREHVVSFFDLAGTAELTVDVANGDNGSVSINSRVLSDEELPWSGTYFQDVPVQLVARPRDGYRFSRWEVDGPISLTDTVGVQTAPDTLVLTPRGDVTVRAVFESIVEPYPIASGPYVFDGWPENQPAGSYPPSMIFRQTSTKDPELHHELEDYWSLPYDRDNRSRVVGLGSEGFAFINTANPQEDGGGYMGAAVLALDLSDAEDVLVRWTGGTVRPNERKYAVRLQYRVGANEPFHDVTYEDGSLVEYFRNAAAGHTREFQPAALPSRVNGEPYVELRWKYYYVDTGTSGPRAMLRVDDIAVAERPSVPSLVYPEPAAANLSPELKLKWDLPRGAEYYRLQVALDEYFSDVVIDTAGITSTSFRLSGLDTENRYYWRVRSKNALTAGAWSTSGMFTTHPAGVTLFEPYPNPLDRSATIHFTLAERLPVRIEIFDVLGQRVDVLTDGELAAGAYEMEWNAAALSNGLYFLRLTAGDFSATEQLMLVR